MIEVIVHEVVRHSHSSQPGKSPVIFLKEQDGDRRLPLRFSSAEGEALAMVLAESSVPRPMTHDLIARLLEALDAHVEKVTVSSLHGDIYYATLRVNGGGRVREIDARPSDALILAQMVHAPIFVESTVLTQPEAGVIEDLDQRSSQSQRDGLQHAAPVDVHEIKTPPGPRGHIFIGNLPEFRRDPLQFLMNLSRQYGDVARFRVGPWSYCLISHPDHVKHVLQDHNHNYCKGRIARILDSITGQSVLVSEGDVWRRQRRLTQPAFHRQRIAALASVMTETTASLLAQWQTYVDRTQPFDIWQEMQKFALGIVSRTLFNTNLTGASDEIEWAATIMVKYLNYRFTHPFTLPLSIPTPRHRQFQQAVRQVDAVVYHIINERRRTGQEANDLLSLLMQARDEETGEGMSDQQLRSEVLTFLFAGYETTASALMWTWYLLAQYPQVEKRLRAELTTVLNGRMPAFADLPQLSYTRMVLEESMRVYPPGWGFERKAISDDEIGGYHVPAGSLLLLCPYITHRRLDLWQNPEAFDPERFTPERSLGRPRYAYFPFGGGPRQCIGNEFAMMECQLIVAMTMQRYQLRLVPDHPVEPDAMAATLRARHGIHMTLHQV